MGVTEEAKALKNKVRVLDGRSQRVQGRD